MILSAILLFGLAAAQGPSGKSGGIILIPDLLTV